MSNPVPRQPRYLTATLVLTTERPLSDVDEVDVRALVAGSAIQFATVAEGITPEAIAAGADPTSWSITAAAQPGRAVGVDRAALEAWLREVYVPAYGPLAEFDGSAADVAYLVQVLHDDGDKAGAGWDVADGISAIHATVTDDGALIVAVDIGDHLRLATIPQENKAFRASDAERQFMDGHDLAVYALEVVAQLVDGAWQAYWAG
ncbi:hypothetical protein JNW90_00985 [Micromonospora sp. STR1s_5]|nr:hypothetical protein [Micromonospora sp. STR1s_5]